MSQTAETDAGMAYPYEYLEHSLVPLPIYAPQHAPYSTENPDDPFDEWPVPDTNITNGPSYRYNQNVDYLIPPPHHTHWHIHSASPSLIPQFTIPPPGQWRSDTSASTLLMAPEMEPCHFYPPQSAAGSSSLPARGKARSPIVYEEYDGSSSGTRHDWEDPQDSYVPHKLQRRKRPTAISSRARTDPQRSSRPKTPRTMSSRPKRSPNPSDIGSPVPSIAPAHPTTSNPSQDYPQASEERQFVCGQGCPARFTRKRDRDRHERSVHTGKTPYRCLGCHSGFVRSDARGRHWKSETECHEKHLLAEMLEEPSPGPD